MPDKTGGIALTIGDPAGIGPEIVAKLLSEGFFDRQRVWIIGAAKILLGYLPEEIRERWWVLPCEGEEYSGEEGFPVIIDTAGDLPVPAGGPSREGGAISGGSIEYAVSLVRKGLASGIVTGPISKEALSLGGYPYRGHTSMLAELFDAPECQMMMVAGNLRIVILTRDIPLRRVPELVTEERIVSGVKTTVTALTELWGIERPKIAVAALNPHAGDGGINGNEEIEVIQPAIDLLAGEGYLVEGPVPSDTLFHDWQNRGVDAFVALYHDQGMIPFKMGGFEKGVNMTIGLPAVRTSVCHGTAYDIAGSGKACTGSLEAAYELAKSCTAAMKRKEAQEI